ncbi:MAG: 5,6-dimethylbenzimidazole synthase [Rhodospirillales bacterium]|nr:5,6-dimethylbenzimidazole synthase [Rhodospirillales bacterium]MBO6786136.1 5,6-dimethylbenzimidazole synthase [Rhodospirillales bacterium]
MTDGPRFDRRFRDTLETLLVWRRDVRRFKTEPLPDGLIEDLLRLAALSPSVGNAQPWRFVTVDDQARRDAVIANFERANADALADYEGDKADIYAGLKLAGLKEAPVHLAVYCDETSELGFGLGRKTMPEMLAYSVVGAVTTLWLAARAHGVGLGWVSILDPDEVDKTLDVPDGWKLVGYLCLGYPVEEHTTPELVRAGWQERVDISEFILKR